MRLFKPLVSFPSYYLRLPYLNVVVAWRGAKVEPYHVCCPLVLSRGLSTKHKTSRRLLVGQTCNLQAPPQFSMLQATWLSLATFDSVVRRFILQFSAIFC